MNKKHVAVLKGGLSAEREVSLASAAAVAEAISKSGKYDVTEIDVSHDIAEQLALIRPDVVFNALHGTYGEDGCIEGLLELMQLPYTHSGVRASAVAMHKPTAKILFETVGIRCASGKVVSRDQLLAGDVIKRPYVVKPTDEGSSVGVLIIENGEQINQDDLPMSKEFLVEEFIAGRELTVGVIGDKVTEICEIKPKGGFYDYKNKYTSGNTDYIIPADIPNEIADEVKDFALKAHNILGCRGVSRSDLRYGDDGKIYMLEVNTHPGMTGTSLIPKLAEKLGMSFTNLILFLIKEASLDNG